MANAPGRIDPMVSLAFSVYSNPGVYALLIGSGVSRSAGIPTGWEITCDLIEKVAAAEGAQEECRELGPEAWYIKQFSAEPGYSDLLRQLLPTQELRRAALAGYFEPSDDERQQHLKTPQAAHRAIARLVAGGHVRVVLTTNFDKLIERALQEEGVTPTVVSTPDQAKGCEPLAHSKHLVVKLHGDYRDSLQRNTESELSKYPPVLRTLLDRILDEFGLIICGWSAEWDHALRGAIERCKSRRYSTYWVDPTELRGQAADLLQRRAGTFIASKADDFFQELEEKVRAMEATDAPHPLSPALAAEAVKRYIASPEHRVRLHDLVIREADTVRRACGRPPDWKRNEATSAFEWHEARMACLAAMLGAGCYWGEPEHVPTWLGALQAITDLEVNGSEGDFAWRMRLYPLVLGVYACGVGAVANDRYAASRAALYGMRTPDGPGFLGGGATRGGLLTLMAQGSELCSGDLGAPYTRRRRMHDYIREALAPTVHDPSACSEAFRRFDLLCSLIASVDAGGVEAMVCLCMDELKRGREPSATVERLRRDVGREAGRLALLRGTVFEGDPHKLLNALDAFEEQFRPQ